MWVLGHGPAWAGVGLLCALCCLSQADPKEYSAALCLSYVLLSCGAGRWHSRRSWAARSTAAWKGFGRGSGS